MRRVTQTGNTAQKGKIGRVPKEKKKKKINA
jgi:hypothetical protein